MKQEANETLPNHLLRRARELQGWSQGYVAERIEAPSASYISRWERGIIVPSPYYREKLCKLFGKNAVELGLLYEVTNATTTAEQHTVLTKEEAATSIASHTTLWNVPHRRNPFFTGREDILAHLRGFLVPENQETALQPLALCGLTGLGKTQIAIEYAYRYREDYSAIFWIQGNSFESLISIAHQLNLPEKDSQKINIIIDAIRLWLETASGWLIILDNVEDLGKMVEYLPAASNGHILVTTRSQATGTLAHSLTLMQMTPEESALFLLRRAKLLSVKETFEHAEKNMQTSALEIAQFMDGLPLALDQAGAYVEETRCSLADYLNLCQEHQIELLKRRGAFSAYYPESVATTLLLCIDKVLLRNPMAANILYFCTFLYFNAIPEELLIKSAVYVCPLLAPLAEDPLQLGEALSNLLIYSLISKDPQKKTLSIHRLTQNILISLISEEEQLQWAQWVLQAVNRIFPDNDFVNWEHCQRFLPQVRACIALVEKYQLVSLDAARLLYEAGYFLLEQAQYVQAECFLQQAQAMYEQILGAEHLATAACLDKLATLYIVLKKYKQAEKLFQRALQIRTQALGPEHPDVAECYNNLATLLFYQKEYDQAEQMYLHAIVIWESDQSAESVNLAAALNNLAQLYYEQHKYTRVEPLLQHALGLWEGTLGANHPSVAFALGNLAKFYRDQKRYEQAEEFFLRALTLREQTLGTNHPRVATSLCELALLYIALQKYAMAERLYKRALQIRQTVFGAEHADVQEILSNLAMLSERKLKSHKTRQAPASHQKAKPSPKAQNSLP